MSEMFTAEVLARMQFAFTVELLSNLVFERFHQAATLLFLVSSIPSLNLTPVMTLAK